MLPLLLLLLLLLLRLLQVCSLPNSFDPTTMVHIHVSSASATLHLIPAKAFLMRMLFTARILHPFTSSHHLDCHASNLPLLAGREHSHHPRAAGRRRIFSLYFPWGSESLVPTSFARCQQNDAIAQNTSARRFRENV